MAAIGKYDDRSPMGSTPTKKRAAAREKLPQLERTIANELPQELSRLPENGELSDVSFFPNGVESGAHGGGRKKAGRPKIGAAVPESRQWVVNGTMLRFTEDGQPTVLAAPRESIQPS